MDGKPSFSVYNNGKKWKDHATGESGDVLSFYAIARGIEMAKALVEFIEMANGRAIAGPVAPVIRATRATEKRKPNLARFRPGKRAELERVAATRNLDLRAVQLAEEMGTLRFGLVCGLPSWILTDESGLCSEGRRLDGKPYPPLKTKRCELGERKAHTLRNSRKAWLVGILPAPEYREFDAISFIEGGPDYLAAVHFVVRQGKSGILPVAMLGRGQGRIDPEALEYFRGKRIRIYPHDDGDGGGRRSAMVWAQQLEKVDAHVDFFVFEGMRKCDGKPVKDLNDCTQTERHFACRLEELFP
jgi:hypothetical protein